MNKITVSRSQVRIQITGWDKLWSFKGSLILPRNAIQRAYRYHGGIKPPWCRAPGTAIPAVIIAGTYYGRGRKEFWNTHFRTGALVLDLKDSEYTRVVVDVDNPEKILTQLQSKT